MTQAAVEPGVLPVSEPIVSPETQEFWDAAKEGKLLIKRCSSCQKAHWYPRPHCPLCGNSDTVWEQASGKGSIYSLSRIRRGDGAFATAGVYVLAYVELDEGPRMMTNIVGTDPEQVQIGQRVRVVFQSNEQGNALPRFELDN
jgi:uncharacterized OB-fold protein